MIANLRRIALGVLLFLATLGSAIASPGNECVLCDYVGPTTHFMVDPYYRKNYEASIALCERDPELCQPIESAQVKATDELMRILFFVNYAINARIQERDDLAQYNVVDYWTLPESGYGDCEDYALEKRQRLIDRGVPAGAIHLVVLDIIELREQDKEAGHAILAVNTDRGLYLLDNLSNELQTPLTTPGYDYLSIQDLRKFQAFNPIVGISF